MKKIRLDLDELAVESFDVTESTEGSGTVQAYGSWGGETCQSRGDYCEPSYEAPCWWTGDPMLDCMATTEDGAPCTGHLAYC